MKETDSLSVEEQVLYYLPLIQEFTDKKIDARQFKTRYLRLVKRGDHLLDQNVSDAVNRLFSDADTYEAYEHLRDSETLDDDELLDCAISARDELLKIAHEHRSE